MNNGHWQVSLLRAAQGGWSAALWLGSSCLVLALGAVMLVWCGELGSVLSVCGVVYCGVGLRSLQAYVHACLYECVQSWTPSLQPYLDDTVDLLSGSASV